MWSRFAVIHPAASTSPGRAEARALPTKAASYLGVYETGPPQTYQPVADFAQA